MKKQILNTIGLAAIAALLCVTCGDNGLDTSPKKTGDVDRFLGRINPTDTAKGPDTTGGPPNPTMYTLNIDATGGGSVLPAVGIYQHAAGTSVSVRATASNGYEFTRWTGTGTPTPATANPATVMMNGNKTLTANFQLLTVPPEDTTKPPQPTFYMVTFNANGATGTAPEQMRADSGASITLPGGSGLTKGSDTFDGWNTNADGTGDNYPAGSAYTPARSITLYARWNTAAPPAAYTVTFRANGGSGTPPGAQTVAPGESVTLPDGSGLTKTGYAFGGWNTNTDGNGGNYSAGSEYTPTGGAGNITLYAKWNLIQYTIVFEMNGGTGSPESGITGEGGKLASLPKPTRDGYFFDGWYTDETGGTAVSTSTVFSENTTIFARWGEALIDSRDGKAYRKVTIDGRTWMAENLNYDVPNVTSDVCWGNIADSCAKYGRLYNWATAMNGASSSSASPSGVQGACPVGWHIPSDAEWTALENAVGGSSIAGKKLKSTTGWNSDGNGTDDFGWSALPGGYGYSGGSFSAGDHGYWWSATENNDSAWSWNMRYNDEGVYRDYGGNKTYLFSVRCVQDY